MAWHAGVEKNQSVPKSTWSFHATSIYHGRSMCKKGQENSMARQILPKAPSLDGLRPWHGMRGSKKIKVFRKAHGAFTPPPYTMVGACAKKAKKIPWLAKFCPRHRLLTG